MQHHHLSNRPDREIKEESEITSILKKGKYMSVSMCRNNEPYIVTLSYGYDSATDSLYSHCSPFGLKLDFIRANPLVCATVIEDGGYDYGECAHNYRTVVFWGTMKIVDNIDEKKHGMTVLLRQLEGEDDIVKEKLLKSENFYAKMEIIKLRIEQIHGKAGR